MKLVKQPTEKAKKLNEKLDQSLSNDIGSSHHHKNKIITFRKIILFLLLNLIYQIELKKNNFNVMIILNAYEISLKINSTGEHDILCSSFGYTGNFIPCPDKIYININEINNSACYKVYVNSSDSIIKFEWYNPLNSMSELFHWCYTITEIDLTNFDTSTVTNMMDMFAECTSLTSINLSNSNTPNVETMHGMFWGCYSLRSLNLKSFDTSKVTKLFAMLRGCESLISIDLSNFDTSEVVNMGELFHECRNLQYINLKNFKDTKNPITTDIFKAIAKNVVICINSTEASKIYDIVKI